MKKILLFSVFALTFVMSAQAQITSVGLIGSATPNGWDADTNMVQVTDSTWEMTIDLIIGEAKFRADDDWAVNWGIDTFPIGTGTQDGPNIPIPVAGTYNVSFNSNSGAFFFDAVSPLGIIGSATPFGWDADLNMPPDPDNPNGFITEINLVSGEAKFRLDDDWAVNWGASDFPTGVGTQDGPNIPIANAGNYTIKFDTATGEYSFRQNVAFFTVDLIGDATGGEAIALTVNNDDPNLWEGSVRLVDGGLQFSGDTMKTVWGGTDFPSGTATEGGDPIPATAGLYVVSFNSKTGDYSFDAVSIYGSIGIIGDATPGGWETDTDMERCDCDSSEWSLRIELLDGEAKFRADDAWDVNWGAGDFPSGTATVGGANIPVTAGEYRITFNSFTGAYRFQELIIYDTIGLIGTATPFGDWDNDVLMTKDAEDENSWYIESVDLSDGECKFRVNQDWAINWGDPAWPSGTGTQDGPNILTVAGTYGVTLNSITGEYMFGDEISSTQEIIRPDEIKAYPNPTTDELNIDVSAIDLQGEVTLSVFNMNGQLVMSQVRDAETLMQLDVSDLPTGNYALRISSERYIIGKRFVVVGD